MSTGSPLISNARGTRPLARAAGALVSTLLLAVAAGCSAPAMPSQSPAPPSPPADAPPPGATSLDEDPGTSPPPPTEPPTGGGGGDSLSDIRGTPSPTTPGASMVETKGAESRSRGSAEGGAPDDAIALIEEYERIMLGAVDGTPSNPPAVNSSAPKGCPEACSKLAEMAAQVEQLCQQVGATDSRCTAKRTRTKELRQAVTDSGCRCGP